MKSIDLFSFSVAVFCLAVVIYSRKGKAEMWSFLEWATLWLGIGNLLFGIAGVIFR